MRTSNVHLWLSHTSHKHNKQKKRLIQSGFSLFGASISLWTEFSHNFHDFQKNLWKRQNRTCFSYSLSCLQTGERNHPPQRSQILAKVSRPPTNCGSSMNGNLTLSHNPHQCLENNYIRYHNFQVKLQNYSYSSTCLGSAVSLSSDSNWSCHKSRKRGTAQPVTFALKPTLISLMHSWPFPFPALTPQGLWISHLWQQGHHREDESESVSTEVYKKANMHTRGEKPLLWGISMRCLSLKASQLLWEDGNWAWEEPVSSTKVSPRTKTSSITLMSLKDNNEK